MLIRILMIAFAFTSCGSFAQQPLTIESFASLPATQKVKLSPNGDRIAWLKNNNGNLVLMAYDFATQKEYSVTSSDNKGVVLTNYRWGNNDILLIHSQVNRVEDTVRYATTNLLRYDLSAKKPKIELLVKPLRLKSQKPDEKDRHAQFQDRIISMLPHDPKHILMAIDYESANLPTIYRVNIETKFRAKVKSPKENIRAWYADLDGDVRLAFGFDDTTYFYRLYEKGTDNYRIAWKSEVYSQDEVDVLGFDIDPNVVYISAYHQGKKALFKVNMASENFERQLIFSDPVRDFDGGILYSYKDGRAIGFTHSSLSNARHYWDPAYVKLAKGLNKALPNSENVIIGMNADETKYILYNESATTAGDYYLGDRTNGSLSYLASRYPEINENNYPPRTKITFKARDGVELDGYLSLPRNVEAGAKLPAIVLPHGGPMARDYDGFHFWAQQLANSGYAVIQPNFRGSSGYGFDFMKAAIGGYSEKMHTDLVDAAKWLVEQGYADSERICIGGASYGGYAALVASYQHSDTFKCAASFAAVSDINMRVKKRRSFTHSKVAKKRYGDDSEKRAEASPINHVDKIAIPLLLVHGDEDKVVSVDHSRAMAGELKSHKKKVTYIELEEGDHSLSYQPHRIKTLKAFTEFFDKHLK